ncbi:MAG: lipopolysaccharide heptosyltransferase II [Lautropia sp.]
MSSETFPRRALIVAPATVTESVLSQPLIALLRGLDPFGAIDVLCSTELAPLYRSIPAVDQILEAAPEPGRLALPRRLALSRRLAANAYDSAFLLQDAALAALAPWLARIPRRFGITPAAMLGLVNRPLPTPLGSGKSLADRFAALALAPGQPLPPGLPSPQLEDPPTLSEARARSLGLDASQPLLLLCPSSELGPSSEWPVRHYAELASRVAAEWPDAAIALLGRARDRTATTQITLLSGQPMLNLAGRLDLAETLAVIGRAAAVVTSESQYMHLAAALGRPHVAIYGAGDPRTERISSTRRSVMWLRLECAPCYDAHCRLGHLDCVNRQSPAAVFASLRRTMRFSATA